MSWRESLRWSPANRHLLALSLTSIAVLIVDQITKNIALSTLVPSRPVPVLGDFMQWNLVFNEGGAFSSTLGSSTFYTVAAVLVTILVLIVLSKDAGKNKLLDYSLALVIGGALGNLTDRLHYGRVVDFVDFDFFDISLKPLKILFVHFPGYHMTRWPVFNVADSAVSVGMVLIIIALIVGSRKNSCAVDPADSNS